MPEMMLGVYTPNAGTGPAADQARQAITERINVFPISDPPDWVNPANE